MLEIIAGIIIVLFILPIFILWLWLFLGELYAKSSMIVWALGIGAVITSFAVMLLLS